MGSYEDIEPRIHDINPDWDGKAANPFQGVIMCRNLDEVEGG
jgi:hypothetical protein